MIKEIYIDVLYLRIIYSEQKHTQNYALIFIFQKSFLTM